MTDKLIAFGLIITATCFLFAILGIAADGWRAIQSWRKSDRWNRANEQWGRWRE